MTDIVQGAHFRAVDAAPAPHGLLATLDAVAAREGVRRLKQRGLDLLAVAAGQRLLDVGCRTGDDVRALASLVGPADPASDPATCWPTAATTTDRSGKPLPGSASPRSSPAAAIHMAPA